MKNTLDLNTESLSIIYVDDNPGDQQLLQEYLDMAQPFDFQLRVADNLEEAIVLMSQEIPDLLLVDLDLGETKGQETIDKAVHFFGQMPILVLSQVRNLEISHYASSRGIVDFLTKGEDFRPDRILRAILMAKTRWDVEQEKIEIIKKHLEESLQKLEYSRELLNKQIFVFSHQIRGPLCTMEGLMSLLESQLEDASKVEILNYLKDTFSHLKSEVDSTINSMEQHVKDDLESTSIEPKQIADH